MCDLYNPAIICITETWLCDEIEDTELDLSNYQLTRFDRNRHGGACLFMYIPICHIKLFVMGPDNLEFLLISVTVTKCMLVFFISATLSLLLYTSINLEQVKFSVNYM